ncbi:MAG: AAA family ATPase [Burkholderiales bacterium]
MPEPDRWRVAPADLYRPCDPACLPGPTSAALADIDLALGQQRATEALAFGIDMPARGHNLFVMGPPGLGQRALLERLLGERASRRPAPDDWCYVFNFATPHRPTRLRLPTGRAPALQRDMAQLVLDLRAGIPAAFEADDYRHQREALESGLIARQDRAIGEVGDRARAAGIALLRTPAGFGFAPLKGDAVMPPAEYQALGEDKRQPIDAAIEGLQTELETVVAQIPTWRRETQRQLRELDRRVTQRVVDALIAEVKTEYAGIDAVRAHLEAVHADVLDHAESFQAPREAEGPSLLALAMARGEAAEAPAARYAVNVLVHHDPAAGAPVVFEDQPSHDQLLGRIEHEARMGMMVTDFSLIRAGALHRANGGYLVLDALRVLTQPLAWDALKRALRGGEIGTESLAQALGLISTVSLAPEPIPLALKVVLVGERRLYYLLRELDPEFDELFKVAADFAEDMERRDGADADFARLLATLARREALQPLAAGAIARLVEQAARWAADSARLSLRIDALADLMRESDHLARGAGADLTGREHVQEAIDARTRRGARISDRLREQAMRGRVLIDTDGERTGQVNALSVISLGADSFGTPMRVTASVRQGQGGVLDIEREVQLGGPVHAKGVLILGGCLAARYCPERPLSLSARLVIEQSYGGIEGDSASAAELCALLSAIARLPLRQSLAVTGSVNQHGEVQAVGGVNEKVEGFFRLCRERGLNGAHGVVVPRANLRDLMLEQALVSAAAQGLFHVHAVAGIDELMTLLTGLPAGARNAAGRYPPGSVNARVEARLLQLAERSRHEATPPRPARRRA